MNNELYELLKTHFKIEAIGLALEKGEIVDIDVIISDPKLMSVEAGKKLIESTMVQCLIPFDYVREPVLETKVSLQRIVSNPGQVAVKCTFKCSLKKKQ